MKNLEDEKFRKWKIQKMKNLENELPNFKNSQNMVIFGKFEKKFEETMKKKIWKRKLKKKNFEKGN